ncbi:lipopolysaccharide biosynthesis protein [Mariniflexile gromovii]|uniref:Lipopolysaccharide biosynthesis protein n=1 Tax=Mariniflexile gromovii TaxID=362523 RepID=A0ABS4BPG1_9FLAO|nr:lipopolysaccharide biosynthesis protein [Mariniflexile gromovii]MBP0902466.1 lipopolysaccharide biosynthesis protein [Mariniflexile gromovii]
MTLKKQALSGVYWTFIQESSSQVISFIVSIILARLLLPSEFGLIAMIGIFMGIGHTLIGSGLSQSLIRTENPDDEDYSTVFIFNLVGSIVIYIFFYFLAPFIASFYNQDILTSIIRVYCITFIINAFSAIQIARLLKQLDFKTQLIVAIPSLIVSSITGISMAYYGFGVWSLVWNTIAGTLVANIQLWYSTKWRPSLSFSKKKFKYHFNYGYKLTVSSLLDITFLNVYTIIIGRFFPLAQVGYYNRAESLKQIPVSNITNIINKVTFPMFSSIQNDNIRLKNVYKQIMQMVIYIISPVLIFMGVLAEPLFRLLLTEKWLPAVPYFQILCFNGILYPIHSYNLNILKIKGRSDLYLKLEIIKKILIVLVVGITFQFGIYGLLYGSVFLSILAFFINTYYSGKLINYNIWEQTKDITPTIFIALICGGIIFLFDFYIKNLISYDILRLILGSLLGSLSFLGITYMLKFDSLKEILLLIKKK